MYWVIITEATPTEDGTDVAVTRWAFSSLTGIADYLKEYEINFGCPLNITIIPKEQ